MFYVEGGIYTDTDFQVMESAPESYGPFDNYEEAYNTWSGKARAQIDVCCHRLVIKEV